MTRRTWVSAALAVGVLAAGSLAAGRLTAQDAGVKPGRGAKTVFVDVGPLGRKGHAATRINQLHEENAREGWTFSSMAPYTENGDLEGFFITYTRE